MKITTRGQVTIPVESREKLGLLPDTEVEFEIVGRAVRTRKIRKLDVRVVAASRSSSGSVAAARFGCRRTRSSR